MSYSQCCLVWCLLRFSFSFVDVDVDVDVVGVIVLVDNYIDDGDNDDIDDDIVMLI